MTLSLSNIKQLQPQLRHTLIKLLDEGSSEHRPTNEPLAGSNNKWCLPVEFHSSGNVKRKSIQFASLPLDHAHVLQLVLLILKQFAFGQQIALSCNFNDHVFSLLYDPTENVQTDLYTSLTQVLRCLNKDAAYGTDKDNPSISIVNDTHLSSVSVVFSLQVEKDYKKQLNVGGVIFSVHNNKFKIIYDANTYSKNYMLSMRDILKALIFKDDKYKNNQISLVKQWEKGESVATPEDLSSLLERSFKLYGHKIAIKEQSGLSISYQALHQEVLCLVSALKKSGINEYSRVVLYLKREQKTISIILALAMLGATYIPVNCTHPLSYLENILKDSGGTHLISNEAIDKKSFSTVQDLKNITTPYLLQSSQAMELTSASIDPKKALYILYTSGSTGEPKGVIIERLSVVSFVKEMIKHFEVTPIDNILQFASLGFDISVFEIYTALCSGATLMMISDEAKKIPKQVSTFIAKEKITVAEIPPAFLPLLNENDCLSLRLISLGGEAFTAASYKKFIRPDRKIINGYGPTEATVAVSLYECSEWRNGSPPMGRPIANTQLLVLDPQMQRVPVGAIGELYIAGIGLAKAYTNFNLTKSRFIEFHDQAGDCLLLYKTGDYVRWRGDANLDYFGRADGQMKINGHLIEKATLEKTILEIKDIQQCCIDVDININHKILIAYVGTDNRELRSADIHHYLSNRLPSYMVPHKFIILPSLPLNANGKVNRKQINQLQLEFTNQHKKVTHQDNVTVERIQKLIKEMTGSLPDITDNLLLSGFNSLTVAGFLVAIKNEFSIEIPLDYFFKRPSIASLADYILKCKNDLRIKDSQDNAWLAAIKSPWIYAHRVLPENETNLLYFYCAGASLFDTHQILEGFDNKFNVFCVALPGRDANSDVLPYTSVDALSDLYLPEVLPLFQKKVIFVGHSMGGLLAYDVARKCQKNQHMIDKLYVVASRSPDMTPPFKYSNILDDNNFMAQISAIGGNENKIIAQSETILRLRSDALVSENYVIPPSKEHKLNAPISVIFGNNDPILSKDHASTWKNFSNAEFTLLTVNAGHFPMKTAKKAFYSLII